MAERAPCFLPALGDEGFAVLVLLIICEGHKSMIEGIFASVDDIVALAPCVSVCLTRGHQARFVVVVIDRCSAYVVEKHDNGSEYKKENDDTFPKVIHMSVMMLIIIAVMQIPRQTPCAR